VPRIDLREIGGGVEDVDVPPPTKRRREPDRPAVTTSLLRSLVRYAFSGIVEFDRYSDNPSPGWPGYVSRKHFLEGANTPVWAGGAVVAEAVSLGWLGPAEDAGESFAGLHKVRGSWYETSVRDWVLEEKRKKLLSGFYFGRYPRRYWKATVSDAEVRAAVPRFVRKNNPVKWDGVIHEVTIPREVAIGLFYVPKEGHAGTPKRLCKVCGSSMSTKFHPKLQCDAALVRSVLES
jgi:hypothetical protein